MEFVFRCTHAQVIRSMWILDVRVGGSFASNLFDFRIVSIKIIFLPIKMERLKLRSSSIEIVSIQKLHSTLNEVWVLLYSISLFLLNNECFLFHYDHCDFPASSKPQSSSFRINTPRLLCSSE
jgi:hypothetical protein